MNAPVTYASIVTFHTDPDELKHCLSLLRDSQCIKRIFVIDNSSLGALAHISGEFECCTYIPSSNVGYGAAHNIAINQSIADNANYHLVLNSDLDFNPVDLHLIIDRMQKDDNIGLAHPRIISQSGKDMYTARQLPTPFISFARRFLPAWLTENANRKYMLYDFNHDKEFTAPYFQGSFLALNVNVLRKVGLFDERFFMYPEDIDLSRRIFKKYKTVYFPELRVVHLHRAESYSSWKMTLIHILNMIKYYNKWGWFIDPERRRINKKLTATPKE